MIPSLDQIATGESEDQVEQCENVCKQPVTDYTALFSGSCLSGVWQPWTTVDTSPSICEFGVSGKEGKLNGQTETRHIVSWGLDTEFTCYNDDQVRGFSCDTLETRHCCTSPCETENGGCGQNCHWLPGEAEPSCSCNEGYELGSDKKYCASISDADNICPSSICWIFENDKCTLKESCQTYLSCSAEWMDFRFNYASLLGEGNNVDINNEIDCGLQDGYLNKSS